MTKKGLLFAIVLSAAMAACGTVYAEEQSQTEVQQNYVYVYQTMDGVLSIQAPNDEWRVMSDPNYWFVLSDGSNTITIDHLANGEALPAPVVADSEAEAVYQAYVSTKNEVFVIKGSAVKQDDLADIMKVIGTIRVLKYDTKTAISENAGGSDFSVKPINETYYSTSDHLNVRLGWSVNDTAIGHLSYGEGVKVIGSVIQDGEDTGWYQIDYKGTTAYASAKFLSRSKPEESSSSKSSDSSSKKSGSSDDDEYFLVYGSDGISVAIHSVGGAMYEDLDGRTYSKIDYGTYYCISTDKTFTIDPPVWEDDDVNIEGDPYGNVNVEGDDYDNVNTEGDPYGDINIEGDDYDYVNTEGDPYGDINVEGDPYGNVNIEGDDYDSWN